MANKYPSVITDYSNIGGMGLVSNPTANDILTTNSGGQAQDSGKQFSTDGTLSANSNNKIPTEQAVKTYVDTTATSAFNLRGGWDASSNLFPTTGGTGTGGAVEAGNLWIITVAGTLGGNSVEPNDIIVALVDTPGQTDSNWNISSNVVLSVNGQTGTVVLTYSDVGAQPLNANLTTLSSAGLTGTGDFVRATSPSLTTPSLGVATSDSLIANNLTPEYGVVCDGNKKFIASTATAIQFNYLSAATGITGTMNLVFSTSPTLTTAVLNGTVTGTGVSVTPLANALMKWDSNNNAYANNFISSVNSVVSTGGTTTLAANSLRYQILTGTQDQTYKLPNATTLAIGTTFYFDNDSAGILTVNDSQNNPITTIPPGGFVLVQVDNISSPAGVWDYHPLLPKVASWGTTTLSFSGALSGVTISGASNTLTNISNSSLTNSSITINGNVVSLGGNTTVTANTTNALTAGTGIKFDSGATTFDGSVAQTISISSAVATLTGSQTLTNKTLTSPAMSGIILSDSTITMNSPSSPSSLTIEGGIFFSLNGVGAGNCTFNLQGLTSITIPTSGTLATLAGSEAFTNKTYNGLTVTTSTGTLTIANSKTLTASNTLTFTGTDSSSIAFGSGGTVAYTGGTLAQFAATTSAQLAGVISDETGSGALVFANTPTLVTPILGTPSSGDLTNCINLPIISGVSGLGTGVATFLATPSSANLASAVTDETGSGSLVFGTTPTFTTNITSPLVIGGTGTTSTLTLKSTSGVGTTGADIIFQAGNNGATEIMRLLNSGNVGVGTTSSTGFRMTVSGGAQDTLKIASTQGVSLNIQNTSTDTIQRIYGTSGTNFWDFRASSTTLAYRVNDQTYMSVGTGANSDVNFTGNINFSTAGKSISYKEGGSDAMTGLATLSNGTLVVNSTSVTANSRFTLTYNTISGTPGTLNISARTAGTSFTISGGGVTNNSTVYWEMHNNT